MTNRVGLNASPEANKRPNKYQTYYMCSFSFVCRGQDGGGKVRGMDATAHLPDVILVHAMEVHVLK